RHPDQVSVIARVHAEITGLDRLLDRLHGPLVVGGDREHPGLGHGDPRERAELDLAAVGVDLQLLDEHWRGPAGSDAGDLLLQVHDRLVHLVAGLVDLRVCHYPSPVLTSVPIGSPVSALVMLPERVTSKTMIGSALSMQNVIAVESITCRPR